jgi:hypothetical protein
MLGYTWQYMTILLQYLPIINNTKQYLTNLVLVGIDKTSSITANTNSVSSWYHHDTVLMVFGLSCIIMILILAIFTKPSMLSRH